MKTTEYLLPRPVAITSHTGELRITPQFSVRIEGAQGARLTRAATNFLRRLAERTGIFLAYNEPLSDADQVQVPLVLRSERLGQLVLGEEESYNLGISADQAVLEAETDLGVLRGLETLLQLLSADQHGYFFPAVEIQDKPRFPWRGLLIDSSRHFQPMEVLKRNLDGMAAVKMNVFHWHITDDQGFRIESKVFPRLHEVGSDGDYYTQAEVRELVDYAAQRGIRVIPEFDIPGHTHSWVRGYPELASAPGPYERKVEMGIRNTVINPIRSSTYRFLEEFFAEMVTLFPDDYIHIGGDENNGVQWLANPEIKEFMQMHGMETVLDLQGYFNEKVSQMLTKLGKRMIGWDEILVPGLPTTAVIHSWRGKESLIEAAKKGYQTILSNGYYIDLLQPAEFHYQNDPLLPEMGLTDEESKNILGGEATMWTEVVSPETIDSRIWPRTAAIAERLWSPREHCAVEGLHDRLEWINLRLEEVGLTHIKNYGMMLRRLTGGQDVMALHTLLEVCEPVQGYDRVKLTKYITLSPLTRAVDAATPDAKGAREFRGLVERYLEQSDGVERSKVRSELEARLRLWQENHQALAVLIQRSPILRELETLSQDLSSVATIGLEALQSDRKEDIEQQKTALEEARRPRGELVLAIIPAIEELL